MRLTLAPHPDTPCAAVRAIAVEVARAGTRLRLGYRLDGDLAQVALAPRGEWARADALWKHSCFEAFVTAGQGYGEINLSPSNQWAAYRFDGYRSGMTMDAAVALLRLEDRRGAEAYELEAELDLTSLPAAGAWSLGLSAVIELIDGRRCFWALRHAPGPPDFHHPGAFALSLSSAESP